MGGKGKVVLFTQSTTKKNLHILGRESWLSLNPKIKTGVTFSGGGRSGGAAKKRGFGLLRGQTKIPKKKEEAKE